MLLLFISTLIIGGGSIAFLLRNSARHRRESMRMRDQLALATAAACEAESRWDLWCSANPSPMWVYDCDSLRFLKVNDAAIKAYGYSREEFLNMTLVDIRPEKDAPRFLQSVRQRHDGHNDCGVWRHRRKDGSIIFVEIMAFEFERDGRREELILATNVTERRRVDEALRDSEASLKLLVEGAPFGIAQSFLEAKRFKTLNAALRKILGGYTLEEALQLEIARQVYADPKDRDRLMEVLLRNRQIEGWEVGLRRRDGSTVPVRITGSLTKGDRDEDIFHAYVEDMTQQSSLEQQVRQVQKLEAVGRLAGGMAHDFNNVLVVIKLSTELMLDQTTPDSPFSKPLLQISNAADRAATLTRQMLAFGRQQIMQPRVINLNSIVRETSQMLRRVIGEDIQLVTSLSDDAENSLLDPDQLGQVVLNLAVNARDAMLDGGMLHLETSNVDLDEAYALDHPPVRSGRYVMLAVSDTGTGIDKAILPRIFDPFFTTKEQGKGTGLGLSIVYGIVKQSGGYVWVYSEPGHGTTFKLYFPATSHSAQRPLPRADGFARPSGQTLLLVEDDATIRCNMRECLVQMGYCVFEADSGNAALEACVELQGKIDLVLTDLVMAGKGGHELAQELTELYPEMRVLFMSGYSEDSAARRDILLRGSPFLQKPFSVADLAKAVQLALTTKLVASSAQV
jgi:two-component system cell cycle sensor histidine kinase/response regulator CckA